MRSALMLAHPSILPQKHFSRVLNMAYITCKVTQDPNEYVLHGIAAVLHQLLLKKPLIGPQY